MCKGVIKAIVTFAFATIVLKPNANFKKQRASKVPILLHDKVNRLLDILEQYEIISPVNKEEQPKGNTFINPVIILAKGESLKIA